MEKSARIVRLLLTLCVVTGILLLTHVASTAGGAKGTLQGTWEVVSHHEDGKEEPKHKGDVYTFADGKMTVKNAKGKSFSLAFKADAAKKTIDLTIAADEILRGIYQIDGKTLKLCLPDQPQGARPTEFKAAKGIVYTVLKAR